MTKPGVAPCVVVRFVCWQLSLPTRISPCAVGIVAAYLQGELLDGEVVYCWPPPGHLPPTGSDGKPQVCKVVKPIYGMAQAGRHWQRTLYPWLEDWGFKQSKADPSVFSLTRTMKTPRGDREETLLVGCYVDDMCILYSHCDEHSLYNSFSVARYDEPSAARGRRPAERRRAQRARVVLCCDLSRPVYCAGRRAFSPAGVRLACMDRNGPCKSRWLGYFVDREVGAIW